MIDNPKNDIRSVNVSQDTGKSKWTAFLLLLGLSTLSVLAILSLWSIMWAYHGDGSLMILVWVWVIMAGQLILVIPATLIVSSVHKRLSYHRSLYEINPFARVGLPLLFNLLAAGSFFISMFISPWINNTSDFLLSRNLTLTIKEESIVPAKTNMTPYAYHAILHAENKTGQEISPHFYLGDYSTQANQSAFDREHQLGTAWPRIRIPIPSGDSDITIDIPIRRTVLFCNNEILAKPWHLLYRLSGDKTQVSLVVDKSINKRLQELVCGTAP